MSDSEHIEGQLPEYLLGQLPPPERTRVARHLEACMACRAASAELEQAVGLASMSLGPPAKGLAQLESALTGARRFEHLVPGVVDLFDVTPEYARELLAKVDQPQAWDDGPAEGVQIMQVEAGPRCASRINALLRLVPGATFPEHGHGDEERLLVLEGGYLDSTGVEVWRGALDVRAKGTSHFFTALEGPACVCASTTVFPGDA
jgi:putative transcriptional regulator